MRYVGLQGGPHVEHRALEAGEGPPPSLLARPICHVGEGRREEDQRPTQGTRDRPSREPDAPVELVVCREGEHGAAGSLADGRERGAPPSAKPVAERAGPTRHQRYHGALNEGERRIAGAVDHCDLIWSCVRVFSDDA